MSSVDISQVKELVNNNGYPVMFQAYDSVERVYPQFCEVQDCPVDGSLYGDKGSVMTGLGELRRRRDGEEAQADTFETAYTWFMAIHPYARKLSLPRRMLAAADASGQVMGIVNKLSMEWGERSATLKDQIVADVFQKGTLSAGDADVFDNSFPNNPANYRKFIYDGKPFFAASGNGHPLVGSTTTLINLTVSNPLTVDNIQTTVTTMRTTNAVNDRAEKVTISPNVIMVPPGLKYTLAKILNSVQLPGTAQNDINPIAGEFSPVINRYLTDDSDAWWMGQRGRGVLVRDSGVPKFKIYFDEPNDCMVVEPSTYFGVTVTDFRYWYANNKATS